MYLKSLVKVPNAPGKSELPEKLLLNLSNTRFE